MRHLVVLTLVNVVHAQAQYACDDPICINWENIFILLLFAAFLVVCAIVIACLAGILYVLMTIILLIVHLFRCCTSAKYRREYKEEVARSKAEREEAKRQGD